MKKAVALFGFGDWEWTFVFCSDAFEYLKFKLKSQNTTYKEGQSIFLRFSCVSGAFVRGSYSYNR